MAGKPDEGHNAAFVVGSILGGVIGAAAALWKAPRTGDELRRKLVGESGSAARTGSRRVVSGARLGMDRVTTIRSTSTESTSTALFSNKVLSFVEKATAPIVGVKLGQTANGSGPAAAREPARISPIRGTTITTRDMGSDATSERADLPGGDVSQRDHVSIGADTDRMASMPSNDASTTVASETPLNQTDAPIEVEPSPASTEIPEGVPGHVPTAEELVTPADPAVPQSRTGSEQGSSDNRAFPDAKDTKQP